MRDNIKSITIYKEILSFISIFYNINFIFNYFKN